MLGVVADCCDRISPLFPVRDLDDPTETLKGCGRDGKLFVRFLNGELPSSRISFDFPCRFFVESLLL